ncbi:MAG: hypothetical protein EOO25_14750 [Comamonadaceae bacterium]|nr:MAG: hypothetical protein EOO25_14750 [Comamonadaceae bacterium]
MPTDPSAAQGFWSGQVNAQTTASAVLLPDGTAWNVLRTGSAISALVRGTTTVSGSAFSITGQSFNVTGGAPSGYSISGTLAPKATLMVAASQAAAGYTLAYNTSYETPARLSDVAGRWNASFGGGSVQLALDFSAAGALTGSSSTGCTYSGSVAPHPAGVAVFNLSLAETCAGTPAQQFAGIATLNEARTLLSAAFTTPSLSAGGLFQATR